MKNKNSATRRPVVPIFVMVAAAVAALQTISTHAASLQGNTYTSSNRTITTMACDDRYLWAGTYDQGLLRIDKINGEMVLYTLSNAGLGGDYVRSLAIDKEGALLVGTLEGGIVRFDGSKWERLAGLAENNVRGLAVDAQGEIWAWMQTLGLFRRSGGSWQPIVNRFYGVLAASPGGTVWAMKLPASLLTGCGDGWINEYVNGGLQSTISLLPICPDLASPQYMVADDKRNCWIGVPNLLIRITDHSVDRYPLSKDTAVHKSVTALAANLNERLLIALSDYSGTCEVFIHDQINSNGDPLDSCAFTVNTSYIIAACADKMTGGFWCAASDGRIIKIDRLNNPTLFATGNSVLPGNSIASLLIDTSDDLWVATENGIARCSGTAWTVYPGPDDSMPGLDVSSLAMDSTGALWAGFRQSPVSSMSISGISCFSGGHWGQLTRDHISVKAIAFDKNGDQWVVSNGGVYRRQNGLLEQIFETQYSSDIIIALGTRVNAIAFDSANIPWIGTGLGIKRYVNNVWVDDTTVNRFLPNNGASSLGVMVNTICFSGGAVWIGTTLGLFIMAKDTCTHIDTAGSLLPDLDVQCIAIDGPNNAWIGTKRGLVRLDGQDHATYTTENSPLCDNDITACAVAPGGDVWAGTRLGGLTILRQSTVATFPRAVSKGNLDMKPVAVSISTLRPHLCCISIQSRAAAAIGFSIISLQGKLIRRFAATSAKAQLITFTWNGTDRSNRPVADGMYLGIVTVNGKTAKSILVPR